MVICANNPGRRAFNGHPQVEERATVRERQRIASVLDLAGPMQVNLKVPASKVDFVAPGLRATVTVDAFPLSTLPAAVASVAPLPDPYAVASWDSKFYTTKVRIVEGLPALRPGMTARVEIKVSELDHVLTLPTWEPGSQAPLLVAFDEVCAGIDLGAKPRMTRQGAFSST